MNYKKLEEDDMVILFLFVPILAMLLTEFFNVKNHGVKGLFASAGFWVKSACGVLFSILMLTILFMDFGAILHFTWLKLSACAISAVFFAVLWMGIAYVRKTGSTLTVLVLALVTALFLEGTLFNFRFYQTVQYTELDVSQQYTLSSHFIPTHNSENEYTISGTSPYIEVKQINEKIHNIYLDLTARNSKGDVVNAYVDVYITDESNENYLRLPAQIVMSEVESTKYLNLVTSGSTENLKLVLSSNDAKTFQINGIRLNMAQDFQFNVWRALIFALLIFVFWLLRPSSKLYSYPFSGSGRQKAVTAVLATVQIVLLLVLTVLNPAFLGNPSRHTAQYQELAESFLDGRLYLEDVPPAFLAEMENPYDYQERAQQSSEHKQSYYWDAAYFEGRYYVYFGVFPVLLLYLPFRAITQTALPNYVAIQVFLCLFVIGSFLLIAEIIKKYFRTKRIPFLSYLILSLIFINASGAVFIAKRPDFYSVPIISALSFTVLGLYFWLRSLREQGRVDVTCVAWGSLCMALVAGCRPQLLLVSAMAIVIFWNSVFRDRSLFSKKGWKSTLAVCLPYVAVAAAIMWYNNARFGSPFDFGANYNLTTNDMTGRGFRVERVGLSIFTYFFQLPNITAVFPFLQSVNIGTNYLGRTITEPMFGGIFAVIPLLWVLILLPARRTLLQKKGILALCLLPLALSFFIGVFDAQGAGLLQRYVSDFAFLACLSALIMVFFLYEYHLGAERRRVHSFLRFALFASGVYCFLCVFAKYSVELFYRNPYLFNTISEMIQFW